MMKKTIFSTILILLCFHSVRVDAETLHVPSVYPTIQAAIDTALDGDIVWVADGVYSGDGNKNIDFSRKIITVQSENGPQNCVIDCEGDGRGFSSISTDSVISGFTIRNAYSSRGAAIYCGYSRSTINNCILINNTATSLGGAVYSQGDAILMNCIIDGNTADQGAGLFFLDASPIITNCKISNNYTSGNSADNHGGGIYCSYFDSAPVITNCVIADNTAEGFGGGVYLDSSTLPVIINTTISGNTSKKGGGIYCESAAVTIKNSIIWENTPSELFIHTNCEQSITYCAIKGGFPGETNFHADPLFIDPGNGNYQLDPKSPCLYAGTSEGAPDTDIQGTARPQGYGYDLGAYESVFSGQRPVIDSFSADIETGMIPHDVTFTCLAHAVASGAVIQQYTIDFGDGSTPETNTSGIFSHLYPNVGIYHATCTVQDDQGNIVVSSSVSVRAAGTIRVPSEYPTIQDAIDLAFEGCTILIADGTYSGAGNRNLVLSGKSVTIISENGPGSCIIDCRGAGGGFLIENGDRSIISGITVLNGNEYYGGGMYIRYASPTVTNCVFKDNTATIGGGIYSSYSSPVIDDCVFVNNETVEAGATPYNRTGGGGIALCGMGSATVGNSVFRENTSFYSGGGIYSQIETQIFNCVFDQNQAEGGGGIYFFGIAPANVTNCSFNGNSSVGYYDGGAIRTEYSSKTIKNSILWGNTPDEISMSGLSAVVTHCDVYGGHEGEGNFHAEPLFADTENGDFRLLTRSPCIDAGTPEGAPDTDIEGTVRPYGDGYDMGAYEIVYDGQRPIIDSFSADTVREQIPFDATFTCTAHDPDGVVATYTMDYGDGSTPESNSTGIFTHTYYSVGPCWAVCTVTDDNGTSVNSLPVYILRQGAIHVPSEYPTVQEAIDAAYDGDAVVLADGIYTGDGNTNLNFAGKAITVRSENGPENCIIDLENNGRAFALTSSEGPDTVISGLTVKNGNVHSYGGAVYMWNASPTIQNCIFTQNTVHADRNSPAFGGAISMRGTSSPNIINCLFSRNQAIGYYEEGDDPEYSYGSAIFCKDESSPSIINCTIVFNTGDHEAAVYSEEISPVIGNSIIWGNTPANISTGNGDFWDAQYNDVEGDYPGVGNFYSDPLFMDADNDNYHLSISSPCIYAASGDTAPAKDILGVERPVGPAPDIGAYEVTGHSTTRPVVVSFTADQDEGETPFPVTFACQAYDVDGFIAAYTMDFGDGSAIETNTTGTFLHTYSSGGTFFAQCTVRDDAGIEIKTKSITLKVHEIRKVPSQYPTIQTAIDAALDEDIVQLADGIYTGEGNKNLNFNGKSLTLRSENGPENSIIDCEGEGRGFIFENEEDSRSVVSGISIINGNEDQGGAIYCADATPLIQNCILSNNTANYGGALYVIAITLKNCRIFNNSAGYGGAIHFSAQSSYDNRISAISNCEFETNVAEGQGGAIYIASDGNRPISGCTFYRNSAAGSGGGIFTFYGRVDVSQSIFIENTAESAGAVNLGRYGSSVVNCVFSKNTANVGGAITGSDTEDFIANCTFYKNTATDVGGAIRTYIDNSDIPILINNIFWENSPDQINANENYKPDVTYSCIQDGYPGEGNFHGDPVFVDPENLDFHLQTNSPCMYAGTSAGAPDIDFEGNPRPQGYGYDIGAYETNGYDKERPIIDSFASDKIEGDLPFNVNFSGSAHDPDGTIVRYTIDYGDGSPPETNQTGYFVHTYTTIGYGDVILTVTDDSGAATNSHSILIKRYGIVYVPSEYPTIQNAVDALLDGNTIVVANGVYTGEGNTNINVYGKSLTIRSLNGPGNCIIDCQGTGRGFIFENRETEETVISGFTILNGNGDAETTNTFGRYRGGGIYCYGSSPTIDNCIVKGNSASYGGGFYCDGSSPIITNCSFLENTSSDGGGGLSFRDSAVSMVNCLVRKNTSISYGGGIYSSYTDTPTSIINCIIADNIAAYAGGICASGFSELFTITNCTVTGNIADNSGGGILCEGWVSLNVSNSILWNNMPDEIRSSTYNTLTIRYSDVQGGYEGEGNFHGNPLFGSDYHLQTGSPCRNAGDPSSASPQFPEHDIDGEVRPQGNAYDIGADEFFDSDGDDIPDYWEYKWFGNLSHDETTNSDTDILTDLEEFENATNPVDSDDDGVPDSVESGSCMDPYDADTDDDGIIDGDEDANQNGMVDSGETDPCDTDTDNDGIQDGTEKGYTDADISSDTDIGVFQPDLDPTRTTDPLNPDTDSDGWDDGEEDANHNGRSDTGETDPEDDASPLPTPPEIVEVLPHDGAGIDPDLTRIANNTSFAVHLEDSDGIDISDSSSLKFTINDGTHNYERNLSDTDVVRVIKLTADTDFAVTELWVVYDRVEDVYEEYDYDTDVNIRVDVKDRRRDWMPQAEFDFNIESLDEHEVASDHLPETIPVVPGGTDFDAGVEISDGDLEGARIYYDSSEPIQPYFGPLGELPLFDVSGMEAVGASMNLQPPTVFTTPVKIFIPCPGQTDVSDLSLYLYNGTDWVLACDADGNVEHNGEGWMVPGSREDYNNDNPSGIEIQVYHFTGIQASLPESSGGGTSNGGGNKGSSGGCFIESLKDGYAGGK